MGPAFDEADAGVGEHRDERDDHGDRSERTELELAAGLQDERPDAGA
jgi:hypothetical protein